MFSNDEKISEVEAKGKALDFVVELLAKTGEPRMVALNKRITLENKLQEIMMDGNTSKEQFEMIGNLLDQFIKLLDEAINGKKEEEE